MDEVFLDATILNGLNSTYIADLYEKWLENPKNVDANWNDWFSDMQNTGSSNDIPSWAKGKAFEEKLENLEIDFTDDLIQKRRDSLRKVNELKKESLQRKRDSILKARKNKIK
jgi:2-oxoglutarate dehydrogenase complex dehydrogenase (E1) component-like enzyme